LKRIFAHRLAAPFVLVLATLVWGASFVVTRASVQSVPPLVFVGLRFGTAALFVGLVTQPRLSRLTRLELRAGTRLSLAMFGGYGLQAVGMHLGVASGRAAFISALYVPLVPVLQLVILRRPPKAATWIGLALASGGLLLMAGPFGTQGAGVPELFVLAGALSIAAEILMIGQFAARVDPRRLAVVECACLSAWCLGANLAAGQPFPRPETGWILSALCLGIASAGLQISVNWAQRSVPPARATLIYTMEPVWAALFGAIAGERMGLSALAGGGLILASLLVSGR
jgi:drug/metabolite transporter (DMT)-like permease